MDVDGLLGVGSVLVADGIDPLEVLASLAPVLLHPIVLAARAPRLWYSSQTLDSEPSLSTIMKSQW